MNGPLVLFWQDAGLRPDVDDVLYMKRTKGQKDNMSFCPFVLFMLLHIEMKVLQKPYRSYSNDLRSSV